MTAVFVEGNLGEIAQYMPLQILKKFTPSKNLVKWYTIAWPCEWLGCSNTAKLLVHDRKNILPDYRMCGNHAHEMREECDRFTLWHLSYRDKGD